MKRTLSFFLSIFIITSMFIVPANASSARMENFKIKNAYIQGQYADVPTTNTFAKNVQTAYEYGIMQGYGAVFGISDNITRLASIIIACRLNCIYYNGEDNIVDTYTGTTQQVYLSYASEHNIYTAFSDYSVAATRSEFAAILSSALPDEALPLINNVSNNAIPDVDSSALYATQIYRLYRAGIVNGSDAAGTFYPNTNITRGAACAIATRMAIPSLRKNVNLSAPIQLDEVSAESIYSKCSPAVFYIVIYNAAGEAVSSGSGFFIGSNGIAVTNYHVINGANSAKITVSDTQKQYNVIGVYNYSVENDWAVIKVDGSGFSTLKIGSSQDLSGGATVFTIGSPLGLQNTISQGLISNPKRTINGINYIQISAPISHGSSGGALLNTSGEVIGITSAGYDEGQNLNLAIPMSYVNTNTSGGVTKSLVSVESRPKVDDPVKYLANFMMNYGTCSILTGATETLMKYTLEFDGANGRTYSIIYVPTTGVLYLSDSYSTTFNDINAILYLEGAGTNEYAAKAMMSLVEKPSYASAILSAFVYRDLIVYDFDGMEVFATMRPSANPSKASDAALQTLFYQMVVDLIDVADEIFAMYNMPIRMSDFGYEY